MKTIAILLTLAACTDDGPLSASEDPRAVSCETFRTTDYQVAKPVQSCYFDVE